MIHKKTAVKFSIGSRVRNVRQSPDGLPYVLTDGSGDGRLIRLEPTGAKKREFDGYHLQSCPLQISKSSLQDWVKRDQSRLHVRVFTDQASVFQPKPSFLLLSRKPLYSASLDQVDQR